MIAVEPRREGCASAWNVERGVALTVVNCRARAWSGEVTWSLARKILRYCFHSIPFWEGGLPSVQMDSISASIRVGKVASCLADPILPRNRRGFETHNLRGVFGGITPGNPLSHQNNPISEWRGKRCTVGVVKSSY